MQKAAGQSGNGEAKPADVDVAVRLSEDFSYGGFDYFYQLDQLEQRLSELLGSRVDLVAEPVRKRGFQQKIDKGRALAF